MLVDRSYLVTEVRSTYSIILIGLLTAYAFALTLDFFIDDPALYGSISNTINRSGNWTSLVVDEQAWLDKPHLPFWISCVVFKITGIASPVTYRIPLLVAIIVSTLYTYLFARDHYGDEAGRAAVIICVSCLYMVLILGEGRHEPYAMLSLIGSIYHGDRLMEHRRLADLIAVSLLLAVGIMSKGTFVAMLAIGTLVLSRWISNRSLSHLLHWHTPAIMALTGMAIYPEIYALRQQFGDAAISAKYGDKAVTAVRWFLWESQFGRFFSGRDNSGSGGDITMYLHTALWACFPWGILLFWAMVHRIRRLRQSATQELYAVVLIVTFMLIFSLSAFQLPHYIVLIIPVLSIVLAAELMAAVSLPRWIAGLHYFSLFLVAVIIEGVLWLLAGPVIAWVTGSALIACALYLIRVEIETRQRILTASVCMAVTLLSALTLVVLPAFVDSRGDTKAARYINTHYPKEAITVLGHVSSRLDYYLDTPAVDKRIYNDMAYYLEHGGADGLYLITLLDSKQLASLQASYPVRQVWSHYNSESDWLPVLFDRPSRYWRHIALVDVQRSGKCE